MPYLKNIFRAQDYKHFAYVYFSSFIALGLYVGLLPILFGD